MSSIQPLLPQTTLPPQAASPDAQTAAVELEGLFVSLLLEQMRQSVGGEGMFPGDQSDIYGGMFDMYLGRQLADNGALGIGQMVSRYLEAANQP
jgi:flagellar protein FlgJ